MRKRLITAVSAFCLASVLFPGAQASGTVPTFSESWDGGEDACQDGRFCLYNTPSLNGQGANWMWTSPNSQPDLGRAPGASDEAESVANRTDELITLYEHWYYGRCVSLAPGYKISDLDKFGLANNVTSVRVGDEFSCPNSGYVGT